MALNPGSRYPGQTNTTLDPTGYPHGQAQNSVSIGDGAGWPLEMDWVNDLLGFQQALLDAAGLSPSGTPDKVGASQYLASVKALAAAAGVSAVAANSLAQQVLNWPERASVGDSSSVNTNLALSWAPIAYGGGFQNGSRFVALTASQNAYTSEDGVSWTNRGIQALAATSNPCVAFGWVNNGLVLGWVMTRAAATGFYWSVDGITWNANTTGSFPANGVAACSGATAAGTDFWVMAGDAGALSTAGTGVGLSWVTRTTPSPWIANCGGVRRVVWNGLPSGGGRLCVVLPLGSYNKVLTSSDGITWTERTLPATQVWSGLAYSAVDGIWMAAGPSGIGATSPDGLTWSNPGWSNFGGANDLAVNGSLWVAPTVGFYGGVNYSRDKGVTWVRGPAVGSHVGGTTLGWNRILFADNRFMMGKVSGTNAEFALSVRTP